MGRRPCPAGTGSALPAAGAKETPPVGLPAAPHPARRHTYRASRLTDRSFNAAAEAFFSSLTWEVLSRHESDTTAQARATVIDWCYRFYHHQRRHSAAAGLSPRNYETTALNRDAA